MCLQLCYTVMTAINGATRNQILGSFLIANTPFTIHIHEPITIGVPSTDSTTNVPQATNPVIVIEAQKWDLVNGIPVYRKWIDNQLSSSFLVDSFQKDVKIFLWVFCTFESIPILYHVRQSKEDKFVGHSHCRRLDDLFRVSQWNITSICPGTKLVWIF